MGRYEGKLDIARALTYLVLSARCRSAAFILAVLRRNGFIWQGGQDIVNWRLGNGKSLTVGQIQCEEIFIFMECLKREGLT